MTNDERPTPVHPEAVNNGVADGGNPLRPLLHHSITPIAPQS
jgi:hypothetical protein